MNRVSKLFFSKKLFLIFLISCLLYSPIYSSQFYDDVFANQYVVYTPNEQPTIELSLESKSSQELQVSRIFFDGIAREYPFLPVNISPNEEIDLSFLTPSNVDVTSNEVQVELEIIPASEELEDLNLELIGDPRQFVIRYLKNNTEITQYFSQRNPELQPLALDPILRENDERLTLLFSNPIVAYQAYFENESLDFEFFQSEEFTSSIISDIPNQAELDISFFNPGTYTIQMYYKDIAGSEYLETFTLTIADPPLEIVKVYSREDSSSYPYYFNPIFDTNTVHSNIKNFDFVFETNHEATCYFRTLSTFREIEDDTLLPQPFSSRAVEHRLSIEIPQNSDRLEGVWIMCENELSPFRKEERVYTSEEMFNSKTLISFVHLPTRNDFEITYVYPTGIVTATSPVIEAHTSHKSFCEYSFTTTGSRILMDFNDDFTQHFRNDSTVFNIGANTVFLRCIDELFNIDEKTLTFTIDPSQGTQITNWQPKLTVKEFEIVEIEVSDPLSECTFVKELSSIGSNNISGRGFEDPIRKEGQKFFFEIGPFIEERRYNLNLKCNNQNGFQSNPEFYIDYDPTPPVVSNVVLDNGFISPTTKFSNSEFMNIDFEVDSSAIAYYLVEFSNSEIIINTTRKPIEVRQNFSADTSFTLEAVDELGRSSRSVTTSYSFDFEVPTIDIKLGNSSTQRIITCVDGFDDCTRVEFGLSSIKSSCIPKNLYLNNKEIDVFGINFLCAQGFDEAGNRVNKTIEISSSTDFFNPDAFNSSLNDTFENSGFDEDRFNFSSEDDNSDNSGFNLTGLTNPPTEEGGFNWVVLSAFAFILLALGAGGYYAYKRGYLDDQLIAMGIKKKSEPIKGAGEYESIGKRSLASKTSKSPQKSSRYDSHLNKLNDFIDSTLNKKSGLFDEFDSKGTKGNVKSFKDTLIENKKSRKEDAKDFESFHKGKSTPKEKSTKK